MRADSEYILRWAKKIKAVKILGGKCQRCGNSDIFVLTFHHIDPKLKENKLSNLLGGAWATIEREILKCQLLCNNCHQEIHFNRDGLNKRHSELKMNLLKYKGSDGCDECGFRGENLGSLDFHHIDINRKKFSIRDVGSSMRGGFSKIAREVDKCSVLCRNCHSKKRVQMSRFNAMKDEIIYMSENLREKQIDRDIVVDMYTNKKMKQIEISREIGCAKSTVCYILKKCLKK